MAQYEGIQQQGRDVAAGERNKEKRKVVSATTKKARPTKKRARASNLVIHDLTTCEYVPSHRVEQCSPESKSQTVGWATREYVGENVPSDPFEGFWFWKELHSKDVLVLVAGFKVVAPSNRSLLHNLGYYLSMTRSFVPLVDSQEVMIGHSASKVFDNLIVSLMSCCF